MQASVELRTVSGASPRSMLLLAGLLVVAGLYSWSLVGARAAATPDVRWPRDASVFAVDGWQVLEPTIETGNGNVYVSHQYAPRDGGSPATLILTTSQNVKTVYRAGADVPFLGSGYESVPLSPEAVAAARGRSVSLLRRADSGWLQVYAYGQTRGQFGNGVIGWGLAIFDTVLGQTTDYYLMRVLVPTTTGEPAAVERASRLADVVFPRLVAWYRGATEAAQPDLNHTPITSALSLNTP